MNTVFYIAGAVAIVTTVIAITRLNGIHALLWLMVSLLAVALDFYVLGAHFVSLLEVIIYAGAIVVLFLFVVMLLNLGERAIRTEREWLTPGMWIGPGIVAGILVAEVIYLLKFSPPAYGARPVSPQEVGLALYGPYVIGVELVSTLLLAGLIGAYHVGWRGRERGEIRSGNRSHGARVDSGRDLVRAGSGRTSGAP